MTTEQEETVVAVPVTIHLAGPPLVSQFIVTDIDAWAWQDGGIFAHGHWYGEAVVRDVYIPREQIRYLEYDFDALIDFTAEEFIEEATSGDL